MWILIWSMFLGNGGGSGSAEFNTKEACEYALSVVKTHGRYVDVNCVPKG